MGLPPQTPREGTPLALPAFLSLKKEGARGLPEQVRAAARSRSDNYSPDDTAFDDDTDRTLTHYR
jgi:hypothetical protein